MSFLRALTKPNLQWVYLSSLKTTSHFPLRPQSLLIILFQSPKATQRRNNGSEAGKRRGADGFETWLPTPFDGFTKVKLHVQTHHFSHAHLLHLLPSTLNPVRLLPIIAEPPLHTLRLSWKTKDGEQTCWKIRRGGPLESLSISQALMSSSVLTLTRRPVT